MGCSVTNAGGSLCHGLGSGLLFLLSRQGPLELDIALQRVRERDRFLKVVPGEMDWVPILIIKVGITKVGAAEGSHSAIRGGV